MSALNEDKLFWVDEFRNYKISYSDFCKDLAEVQILKGFISENNPYKLFLLLVAHLYQNRDVVILDPDIHNELNRDPIPYEIRNSDVNLELNSDLLISQLKSSTSKITLFTSGTTGKPKKISHNFNSITRNVKTGPNYALNVWAFAYNPTHIAGLQVFCQGFFNSNTMVYTFETPPKLIPLKLKEYNVTNISATPSYYRLFFPFLSEINVTLKRITSGGEKFDENIIQKIKHHFPNAVIRNIYATTEAGSLLNSDGEYFVIDEGNEHLFRINEQSELQIHESLLGKSDDILIQSGWYNTGDIVDFADKNKLRIIGRSDNLINIGGYKINSDEICDVIKGFDFVNDVLVYSQTNSVLGKVLVADIILNKNFDKEVIQHLKKELNSILPKWKVPVKFNIVNQFQLTRTGKKLVK